MTQLSEHLSQQKSANIAKNLRNTITTAIMSINDTESPISDILAPKANTITQDPKINNLKHIIIDLQAQLHCLRVPKST